MDSTGGALLVGMDSTAVESPTRKQAEEGALLAPIDPTGGESSTWDWAKQGARLLGLDSKGGERSMPKQDDEASREAAILWKEAMEAVQARRDLVDFISIDGHKYQGITRQEVEKLILESHHRRLRERIAQQKRREEFLSSMANKKGMKKVSWSMAMAKGFAMEAKAKAKANTMEAKAKAKAKAKANAIKAKAKAKAKVKDEEALKAQVTESGKALMVGSSKSAMEVEVMGKEPLQQLLKGMPNKFDILDPDGDDKKVEVDRGKSAIEEEHVPSDWMNPGDRGEVSLTVGSGKSVMDQEVISPEMEESVTEVEETVKEAEEGALLAGMDSIGGESSTRMQAEEVAGKRSDKVDEIGQMEWLVEDIVQIERRIALLGIKEKFAKKEAALLAGVYAMDGESLMWKQAEESRNRSEMQRQAEKDMMIYFSTLPMERGDRAIEHYYVIKYEAAAWKALVSEVEKWKALLASQEKSVRREKARAKAKAIAKAKAKANEEARKVEASVAEAGRPEESVTEAGKAEEAVVEECYFPNGMQRALLRIQEKWAKKNNNPDKETLRQLVKDLSDKFDISMRSMSAIEEHAPMVESDELLLQPADPSDTNSMIRLGVQDDLHHDKGKSSATTLAKTADKEMAYEAKNFDLYRSYWESAWSNTRGSFEHMTALSSMQFTYYTPGCEQRNDAASNPATLQIFSIKLAEIAGCLGWPLSVYGVVAVRDAVDQNRNFLFSCDRDNSQELTQNDPFLRLIGPSRAVVYIDMVHFEVQLKVKGTTESQDKDLITEGCEYHESFGDGLSTLCFKNCFCAIELCVQVVRRTTQATILGVQVARGGQWPFEYGARVTCSALPGKWGVTDNRLTCVTYPASGEIVMVDSKDGASLEGCDGYLHLPRNVISVETEGRLDVEIEAYSKSGKIAAQQHVKFQPKFSKISQGKCFILGNKVVITVAWSLVATDKRKFMELGRLACGC